MSSNVRTATLTLGLYMDALCTEDLLNLPFVKFLQSQWKEEKEPKRWKTEEK